MNTQNETRVNEQEYSDIKVSKETATVILALHEWFNLSKIIGELNVDEDVLRHDFDNPLYECRDNLESKLIYAIAGMKDNVI